MCWVVTKSKYIVPFSIPFFSSFSCPFLLWTDPVCIIPSISKHAKMRCPSNTAAYYPVSSVWFQKSAESFCLRGCPTIRLENTPPDCRFFHMDFFHYNSWKTSWNVPNPLKSTGSADLNPFKNYRYNLLFFIYRVVTDICQSLFCIIILILFLCQMIGF